MRGYYHHRGLKMTNNKKYKKEELAKLSISNDRTKTFLFFQNIFNNFIEYILFLCYQHYNISEPKHLNKIKPTKQFLLH